MQFDATMMKRLISTGDTELWQTIRTVAEQSGISLPEGQPSAADMARLRAILASKGAGDVQDAMEVLRRAHGGR